MAMHLAGQGALVGGMDLGHLRVVLGPRGIGKTHFAAMYAVWCLYNNIDERVILISRGSSHAKASLEAIRQWIKMVPWLKYMHSDSKINTAHKMVVSGSTDTIAPSLMAVGERTNLAGSRATKIITDDIENEQNVSNAEMRAGLRNKVSQCIDLLYADGANNRSEIAGIGTFWHNTDSVYMHMDRSGFNCITYPISAPRKSDRFLNLAPVIVRSLELGKLKYSANFADYPNNALFPHIHKKQHFTDRMEAGESHFSMQHMLLVNAGSAAARPLRLASALVMPLHPDRGPVFIAPGLVDSSGASTKIENIITFGSADDIPSRPAFVEQSYVPYQQCVAFIDPAGVGTDRTGVAVVATIAGTFFVKACVGLTGGATEIALNNIVQMLKRLGVNRIYYEDNMDNMGAYGRMLRLAVNQESSPTGWAASVEPVRVLKQKEARIIETLAPLLDQRRLVFDPSCFDCNEAPKHSLQYQIQNITHERKSLDEDGKIDALASACSQLLDAAGTSTSLEQGLEDGVSLLTREMDRLRANLPQRVRPKWAPTPEEIRDFRSGDGFRVG